MRITPSIMKTLTLLGILAACKTALGADVQPTVSMPAWPEYTGRLVVSTNFDLPQEWAPQPVIGSPFWIYAPQPARYSNELAKIYAETSLRPMFDEGVRAYYLQSLIDEERNAYNRLLLREVEIFGADSDRNLAPQASVSAEAEGAQIKYIERVNDADISLQSACYSSPARYGADQKAWVAFAFDKDVRIQRVVIHGGRPKAEGTNVYAQLPSRFVIQYQAQGGWKDIPGTAVLTNNQARCELRFDPISAKAIRIRVDSQSAVLDVSALKLRDLKIDPDRPFFISDGESRPPFRCFEEARVNKEDYARWKNENTNFIGFFCGTEWDNDYGYLHNTNNIASVRNRGASENVLAMIQERFWNHTNRDQAMNALHTYHQAIRTRHFDDLDKMMFMDCGRALNHYAMEWGGGIPWIETTCAGYQRHQPQMYFVRGASRQYGKPWGWYVALGMVDKDGYVDPDYMGKSGGGPDFGISPSLNKRDRYLAYLAGANFLHCECFPFAYCLDKDHDGVWELSPHGEVLREWYDFIRKHPDRGISYAPIALALPFSHGQSPITGGPIWGQFPQERSDHMIEAFLRVIVPWHNGKHEQEYALANSPFGDLFDIILPDPPSGPVAAKILSGYKAMILVGDFAPSQPVVDRLMNYVQNGGTLVMNIKQVGQNCPASFIGVEPSGKAIPVRSPVRSLMSPETMSLPNAYMFDPVILKGARPILVDADNRVMACVNEFGRGRLVLATVDYLLPENLGNMRVPTYSKWQGKETFPFISFLLARLVHEVIPVDVTGDIQYGFNKVSDGWWIYLINNKGIYKSARNPQRLDTDQTATVEIGLRNLKPLSITDLRSNVAIQWDTAKNSLLVRVAPGDVNIIKIKTEGGN